MEPTPLQALAGRLIPASSEFGAPGADDPIIFADIAGTLAPNRAELADLLADLDRTGAAAIAERPLDSLLAEIAGAHGAAFGLVSVAVIQAYYRDDRVMRSLGLEARPPFPKGYPVEEGDFSLVDPVRARGPIWRAAR
jgi:hypothetical protein